MAWESKFASIVVRPPPEDPGRVGRYPPEVGVRLMSVGTGCSVTGLKTSFPVVGSKYGSSPRRSPADPRIPETLFVRPAMRPNRPGFPSRTYWLISTHVSEKQSRR